MGMPDEQGENPQVMDVVDEAVVPSPSPGESGDEISDSEDRGADQFVTDGRVEEVLKAEGVNWDFKVVAIADIDVAQLDGGDSAWQMRDQIIDPLVAERYGDDLGWGTKFPAGILAKAGGGKYHIVDFHHRIEGARRAKLTQVSAYVLDKMSEPNRILLGFKLNRNHGKPLSDAERVREGVRLLRLGHFSTARQAAHVLGTSESRISFAKRIEDAQRRASEVGVSAAGFGRLGKSTQERLGSIEAPGVFREAANKIIETGLPSGQVNELVKAVNAVPSEAEKIEVVRSFGLATDEPEAKPRAGGGLADAWHRSHMACRSLLSVETSDFSLSLTRRSDTDARQLLDELEDVLDKLAALSEQLQARLGSVASVG